MAAMQAQVEALQAEVAELRQTLCDRTQALEQLTQEKIVLEQKYQEQTAYLKVTNDTLVDEVVEHTHAENALKDAKDQLQAILDAVPGIVSWISSDLRYLGVNRHLAQTFKMPAEAFTNQDIGFLHTSTEFNQFVTDFFQSDQQDAFKEVSAYVGGNRRQFLIVAQKYNEGKAAFTVGIDISERKQAEEALREAEAKYRNIFENTVEGIFQTTADGHYISANPALARIYGYDSPADMMANITSIQQQLYINPKRRVEFTQLLQQHGSVKNFESQVYQRDGNVIWISENARSVYADDGSLLYYEGTVEDISDRKAAEAALQRANEELEQRVTARTEALSAANERLITEIRERQRAEEELQASTEELKALFAAMTDVITVFDAEGQYLNIVATNSALVYNPETEREGKNIYGVLPPYQAQLFMRHIQQALNTRQPVRLDYSLPIGEWRDDTHPDGIADPEDFETTAWYTAIVSPMPNNRVIWVARDITERRRADLALQRAEEKYRSIFEHVAEGIFQVDGQGRYLSANPALAKMLGYLSPAELIGQVSDIRRLYVDAEQRQALEHQLHSHDSVAKFESRVYRADGTIIWVSENVRTVRDNNGQILYYEGTVADITQRKQAEEALRASQRDLATLMGNLAGMAYRRMCDQERQLAFVSEGCYELTGYQPDELMQVNGAFGRLVHPEDHGYVGEKLQRAIQDRQPFETTYRMITAAGTPKWVLEKGVCTYAADGTPEFIEGFITDITERKQIEEALQVEREKSERLLLNILPEAIAEELKQQHQSVAYRFQEATILFADIVDFTGLSVAIAPTDLVDLLNQIFSIFDQLAETHGLEKIKTIGDAYMVVGGVPNPMANHTEAIADMALDMQQAITQFKRQDGSSFGLRIGIATGPVVAGVIGKRKFSYDLWGAAVNVASRMESQGHANRIQVTEQVYQRLNDHYHFQKRGIVTIKGRGEMTTYWLLNRRDP